MMDELFFSKEKLLEMYKLKNITRYNHRTRLKDESVAEHSFFTTLITLELCKRFKLDNESMLACLLKSLLHDMPETELNDITYDVKVALNLYPLLKVYEDKYFEKHFPELATLLNDESENAVNLIVKYADATSVLQYAYNEIELGNVTFEAIKDETLERLKTIEQRLKEVMKKMKNLAPYSAGYSDIDVSIVDYDKNIAKHAWNCYRMTWRELQDVEYDVNDKRVREAIRNIIAFKALPMPREQALMTFRIENASRVCLAQITRQRKAAFNVESQMPQPVGHNVIIPLNIWQNENLRKEAIELCEASQNFYNKLIDMGIPYQDARYMLIHGQTTSFVYVVDINTFCGSFSMRCENNLSDEINLVYRLCLRRMLERLEKDYECGDIDELTYLFYKNILAGCDCQGARQKKGMNTDKVFGNSFMRFDDANEEVAAATVNCTCDFKKSAWYAELMRIYNDKKFELLFLGEKEMIERWKAGYLR